MKCIHYGSEVWTEGEARETGDMISFVYGFLNCLARSKVASGEKFLNP
jgi:hypothetical protein